MLLKYIRSIICILSFFYLNDLSIFNLLFVLYIIIIVYILTNCPEILTVNWVSEINHVLNTYNNYVTNSMIF